MSIPAKTPEQQFERFSWTIRLAPLAVAIILAALWLAGTPSPVPDLRLSAPVVARPGHTIGLRAWLLDEDDQGFTVVRAPPVRVELRNVAGMTLAETELRPSSVQGAEGAMHVPLDLDATLTLVALAEIDGREVSTRRALYVRDDIESRLEKGRAVNSFQAYELGPLHVADRARAPSALDPRVEEGACVPELQCRLSVWVGAKPARVRVRSLAGVAVGSEVARSEGGFAHFALSVVGNEARVEVEALDENGVVLAAREARLPVVPGGLVARSISEPQGQQLEWEQLGGGAPVLVDVFEDRRWVRALSLSPEHPRLPELGAGVWRLQVRADLFSDNTAGVAYVVVTEPNGPDRVRLAADAVLADADREGLDPLALAIVNEEQPDLDADAAVRSLFAVPSFDVISIGPGVSARLGLDEALRREQEGRRWIAAALILVIGFIVSMILFRTEVVAQSRARQLLRDLGEEPPPVRPLLSPGRGLWAFVLLVFVLMAVLALSKRWF